jgi:ATP-dependent Zn protease
LKSLRALDPQRITRRRKKRKSKEKTTASDLETHKKSFMAAQAVNCMACEEMVITGEKRSTNTKKKTDSHCKRCLTTNTESCLKLFNNNNSTREKQNGEEAEINKQRQDG